LLKTEIADECEVRSEGGESASSYALSEGQLGDPLAKKRTRGLVRVLRCVSEHAPLTGPASALP